MPYVKVETEKNEDVLVSYADYGEGRPIVLIHGWPLSHVMFEYQIPTLVEAGYRVIAYDRRGFGESYRPWEGYDYDTLASDLDALLQKLDLHDVTLVGFSMGGGEVARYVSTFGKDRIRSTVLMSAVTPFLLKTDDNPDGVDNDVFDTMRTGLSTDRAKFLDTFGKQFVNWHTIGTNDISQEGLQASWNVAVSASPRATRATMESFATTDFRSDLTAFENLPTLVVHGSKDEVVPLEASGQRTHEALTGSRLEVIDGGPHGITLTHAEEVNRILLDFLAE